MCTSSGIPLILLNCWCPPYLFDCPHDQLVHISDAISLPLHDRDLAQHCLLFWSSSFPRESWIYSNPLWDFYTGCFSNTPYAISSSTLFHPTLLPHYLFPLCLTTLSSMKRRLHSSLLANRSWSISTRFAWSSLSHLIILLFSPTSC